MAKQTENKSKRKINQSKAGRKQIEIKPRQRQNVQLSSTFCFFLGFISFCVIPVLLRFKLFEFTFAHCTFVHLQEEPLILSIPLIKTLKSSRLCTDHSGGGWG